MIIEHVSRMISDALMPWLPAIVAPVAVLTSLVMLYSLFRKLFGGNS